nr:hypothetical protein [Tanacetum cinerariifolium]
MESDSWPQIYAGIQQHLQKIYNGKKTALKERYWVPKEDETYDLERNRRKRPSHISEDEMLRLQCLGSNTPRVCPTLRMRSWPLFVGASSEGTFLVLNEFCQDWAQPDDVAWVCRPGKDPIRDFPFHLSWMSCRPGKVGADVVSMGIPYTAQAAVLAKHNGTTHVYIVFLMALVYNLRPWSEDIQDDVAVRRMEEIKVKVFYRALRWRPILHRSIPE